MGGSTSQVPVEQIVQIATMCKYQKQDFNTKINVIKVKTMLAELLPKRLTATLLSEFLLETSVTDLSDSKIDQIVMALHELTIKPNGTEGYRTAEVTLGGVDCAAISSKTMQSQQISGLFFIGEVLDVSGWLGGYNFQWAWSSGWCAGQYV